MLSYTKHIINKKQNAEDEFNRCVEQCLLINNHYQTDQLITTSVGVCLQSETVNEL